MSILNKDDMMFLNNKEKKEKANAISYKIDEYIWGRKADTPMLLIRLVTWDATLANGR